MYSDGSKRVTTDDGVFRRVRVQPSLESMFPTGAVPRPSEQGRTEMIAQYGTARVEWCPWQPRPSARAILVKLKQVMGEAWAMEAKEKTWCPQLLDDAEHINGLIAEAEYFIESGKWDWAGGILFEIGRLLAEFQILEGLGPKIRAKRSSDEGPRGLRGPRNTDLKRFMKLRPNDWRRMRPKDAVAFMRTKIPRKMAPNALHEKLERFRKALEEARKKPGD